MASECYFARVPRNFAQRCRFELKMSSLYDCNIKVQNANQFVDIPVVETALQQFKVGMNENFTFCGTNCVIVRHRGIIRLERNPLVRLLKELEKMLSSKSISIPNWRDEVFTKYEKHGDMILIPEECFTSIIWKKLGQDLWQLTATTLGGQRLASKGKICANEFRAPNVKMLFGESSWVEENENGIKISYDITKCMHSAGNISEKVRIASFQCEGEVIVDLFCGIGYFTLPYIIHAKAAIVHACEWNPDAVEALRKNLKLNKVEDKCIIHFGNSSEVCPVGIADRINLGLLPSSRCGWEAACKALKPTSGGILHIHEVVSDLLFDCICGRHIMTKPDVRNEQTHCLKCTTEDCVLRQKPEPWHQWSHCAELLISSYFPTGWTVRVRHLEHVKHYAPHLHHLVLDVDCRVNTFQ